MPPRMSLDRWMSWAPVKSVISARLSTTLSKSHSANRTISTQSVQIYFRPQHLHAAWGPFLPRTPLGSGPMAKVSTFVNENGVSGSSLALGHELTDSLHVLGYAAIARP